MIVLRAPQAELRRRRRKWRLDEWQRAAPRLLKSVAGVSGLLAALLYGYGWLFLTLLFGSFGVDLNEVGIDFQWVLVRVIGTGFLVALAAAILVLVPAIANMNYVWNSLWWIVFSATVLVVGVDILLVAASNVSLTRVVLAGLPACLLAVGLAYGLLRVVLWYTSAVNFPRRLVARGAVALTLAIAISALPWLGAQEMERQIRSGQETAVDLGVGLNLIQFRWVRVDGDSRSMPGGSSCLVLLGQNSGVAILYDLHENSTLRVPMDGVVIRTVPTC